MRSRSGKVKQANERTFVGIEKDVDQELGDDSKQDFPPPSTFPSDLLLLLPAVRGGITGLISSNFYEAPHLTRRSLNTLSNGDPPPTQYVCTLRSRGVESYGNLITGPGLSTGQQQLLLSAATLFVRPQLISPGTFPSCG